MIEASHTNGSNTRTEAVANYASLKKAGTTRRRLLDEGTAIFWEWVNKPSKCETHMRV